MRSRLFTFIGFVIGGLAFQGIKIALGDGPTWGDYATSLYWAGAALYIDWLHFPLPTRGQGAER